MNRTYYDYTQHLRHFHIKSPNETLHLLSMPRMRESIRDGMAESLEECDTNLDW